MNFMNDGFDQDVHNFKIQYLHCVAFVATGAGRFLHFLHLFDTASLIILFYLGRHCLILRVHPQGEILKLKSFKKFE